MNPIRIDIPDARRDAMDCAVGDVVYDALREAGIDPDRAATIPAVPEMAAMWVRGEWTRERFIRNARKLLIVNPTLALEAGR